MKRLSSLAVIIGSVALLASCKNGLQSGIIIPKDAAFAMHVNSSSLSSKLSWNEIKNSEWFKDMSQQAEGDTVAQKLLNNPDASGIDLKSDFAYFVRKRGRGGYGMFEGSVKDAAAFESTLKNSARGKAVTKDGDWSVMAPNNSTVILWNKSKFAVVNDVPIPGGNPMMGGGMNEVTKFEKDSLQIFGKQTMGLDADETLADDDRFEAVMNEPGDMHIWVNAGNLYGDMMGMFSMMKAGTLLEGNAFGAGVSFDDGKITVNTKQFYNTEMAKLVEKMKGKDIGTEILNRVPAGNVIAVMAASFNPQGLKDFVKALGVDGMINSYLGNMNLTLDEILSATKGDFLISLTDLQMKDTTITYNLGDGEEPMTTTSSQPDFNAMLAISVNQKGAFDKLIGITRRDSSMRLPVTYNVNNEWFVLSNKPATVTSFLAATTTKHIWTDKVAGNSSIFYLDLQQIFKTKFANDSGSINMQAEAAAVWKDVVATGTEYGKNSASGKMVINFMDEKTNSLKQLNAFATRMYAAQKQSRMRNMDQDMIIDTVGVQPPPVEMPMEDVPMERRNN